ncbi:MAG: M67 family metallopeptidase [Deltaproteobacteria bacterium]|nr:M67 family metallopeptidase [Deltaproteobacteria bacterium]
MFFFDKSILHIQKAIYGQMLAHAEEAYPNECCGILVGSALKDKRVMSFERAANVNAERAKDRYIIDPREIYAVDREARAQGMDILGFYHSHPDHPDRPSEFDREWGQPGYSYVIISVKSGKTVSVKCWMFEEENAPFKEEKRKVG